MKLELSVVQGKQQGTQWRVEQPGTYYIGRRPDADFFLAHDRHISRQHCHVELTGAGVCRIVDTSRGGTVVGGVRIKKAQLANRDVIKIGQTVLNVALSGGAPRIPGFILEQPLAGIGPGEVWSATSQMLDQPVTLHFMALNPADKTGEDVVQRRFVRAAGICARTQHPGLLNFLDQNISGSFLWFATEPGQGQTLQQLITEQGALSVAEAVEIISQTLDIVAYLHQKGIVHRGLHPQSLLVHKDEDSLTVRLTDLGSAKCFQPLELQYITGFGERGFPIHGFTAPEVIKDFQTLNPRSDLYAVGAILYFILAGHPPYKSSRKSGVIRPILQEKPPSLRKLKPNLSPAIVSVVEQAMAADPNRRYKSASSMLDALRRTLNVLEGPPSAGVFSASHWPAVGQVVDHYKIVAEQGRGRMGTVYRARDTRSGRMVALKLFRLMMPQLAHKKKADSSEIRFRQRFEREIRLASQLNHPHIVTVYDVNLNHEPPYLVMELLQGGTLEDRLAQEEPLEMWLEQGHTLEAWFKKQMSWAEAFRLLRPLVQALAYTHQAGAVHRDVKPANIMFALPQTGPLPPDDKQKAGLLKLVDFGLARWDQSKTLTQTSDMLGDLAYLSPEQARSQPVDNRSDIFAVGLILFEAITGVNPINKGPVVQTILELASNNPLDTELLHRLKLPAPVIHLIEQAIAKNPDERQPTCEILLAQMDECLEMAKDIATPPPGIRLKDGPPPALPTIEHDDEIKLNTQEEALLKTLFNAHDRIVIEEQFLRGLSSSRVLRVRPVDETGVRPYLPAVVKIGPSWLIEQEWRAYQIWVEKILPDIARLEGSPILGKSQGILRYALVGSGIFPVRSLYDYYRQREAEAIRRILVERLFKVLGQQYWQARRPDLHCHLGAEYDSVLPVNFWLKVADAPLSNPHHQIEPQRLPNAPVRPGQGVHLKDFVVTEINVLKREITLNLPPASSVRAPMSAQVPSGYRIRLTDVPNPERYQAGRPVSFVAGQVTDTRHNRLLVQVKKILPNSLDLNAETLPLSADLYLPNPLQLYPALLNQTRPLYRATVHGDFNLENILIDPQMDVLSLIDFATVRRGHCLHDLLRLETEVVTKLLPLSLRHVPDPLKNLYSFYHLLHRTMILPDETAVSMPLSGDLKKAYTVIGSIRQAAREHLYERTDWAEYYQGLTLYLLGALKFRNLDMMPEQPLPKQLAFWASAVVLDLLGETSLQINPQKPA